MAKSIRLSDRKWNLMNLLRERAREYYPAVPLERLGCNMVFHRMRRGAIILLTLLIWGCCIALSACASPDANTPNTISSELSKIEEASGQRGGQALETANDTETNPPEMPDTNSISPESGETDEASAQSGARPAETEEPSNQSDAVILEIYGRWNEEEDIWDSTKSEYILSPEDSEFITGLFYDHEKEVIDSPIASVATLGFRTGEDHLSSSMGGLNTFDGTIGGESVVMGLSESERETVRQIILTYAPDTIY